MILAIKAIYYRWTRGGGAGSLLLLPSGSEIFRILGCGVIFPMLLYYLITRWLPWTGRDFSLIYGFPQFIAQYLAVLCAILMGTIMLADNCVRRRCRELLLPVAPPTRNLNIIAWVIVGVLLALAMLPQFQNSRTRGRRRHCFSSSCSIPAAESIPCPLDREASWLLAFWHHKPSTRLMR